jgi:hypothetical protein
MDKKNDPTNPIAHVSSTTPPMFLAHAGDDAVSPRNSVEMYLALLILLCLLPVQAYNGV